MTICGRCGEEVRYGTREGHKGFLHRGDVDHAAILGQPQTAESIAKAARQRNEVRLAEDGTTYTTAEFDIMKDKDADRRRQRLADLRGEDPDHVEPLPLPEVVCHPVGIDSFPPRSGIRQILNLIDKTDGWELRRLTHSRGPYVGSSGVALSISDSIVMGARGPALDSGVSIAVASWRDGSFDFAYTGILKGERVTTTAANSKALKAWIKDTQ